MDGFTLIDGVVALVIIVSAILSYARGFVREAMSIVGWIAAAVIGFIFAPKVVPLIAEIPVLGSFLGESCELGTIASFAAVLAVSLVVVSIFTSLFSSAVQRSVLGGFDQAAGFIFGVLRGIVLVALTLVIYDRVMLNENIAMVENSRTAKVFARSQASLESQIPDSAPGWIVARYEQLVSTCTAQ